ncbi:MAG: amidohydrolase family protein [Planctomycetes bacterium]|nr:amidohydrolase family protein [Planctomycetota bacterium]
MMHWGFFDARCTVGRHVRMQPGGPHTAEHLLAEMDRYGVAEALVVDSLSREHHPLDGNRRVLETTAPHARLHPAWAALPPGADEQPAPEEFLRQMRARRVGALFLFTGQYRFGLFDWAVDALLEPMAEARVPVFICPNVIGPGPGGDDRTDLGAVVALCRRLPELPVIVTESRIRYSQRMIYRALDACPNLRIELSGYWLHHGVEYITRRWGAERLIFGSNWPKFGHHMTLTTLTCADIDDEDKRQIAGGNLRELIRWCSPEHPSVEFPPPEDEYVQFGRTGVRPADMEFHDCHGHLGPRAATYHLPDCDLDSIVRQMDRLGVQKTCVFSFAGVTSDERFGNDIVADAVRRYPSRFVGFTLLNPHRGREGMLDELERCAALGLRGIKLIPYYQEYPDDGPMLEVAARWAHEHRQIVLNHHWGPPEHLERLLARYPDACFINGHTTLGYADLMQRYPNLYICSCALVPPHACEDMVARIGADRLLFGSDMEDLPIAWGLGPILFARLPVEQKRMILGGNLLRLLERYSLPEG